MDRYARPSMAEKGCAVADASVEAGHVRLRLKSGTAAEIFAGSDPVGFFFAGEGSWEYVSQAPEEFPMLERNAREISRWKPVVSADHATVSDGFTELLWISTRREKFLEAPAPAGAPAGPFRKHLERFSNLLTEGFPQRLAYRQLAGSSGAFAWAQLTGGKNDAVYFYDDVLENEEQFAVLKKLDIPGSHIENELEVLAVSRQPISRRFRDRAPVPAGLTRVEANVEADGEHAKIRTRETFVAVGEPLKVLNLSLRSRVWDPRSSLSADHRLTKVSTAAGADLPFDHRRGNVLIELPTAVPVGQSVALDFEMDGDFLQRPGGDNYWILGLSSWFPEPGLEASAFTWSCTAKVRKPFLPIASGRTLERREEGDWNIVRTEIENPVFLPVVLAGKYRFAEEVRDGRTIRVASYAFRNERAAKQMANLASQIIAFYEPFLGPFPWKEFTIVEINAYGFGVAPADMMFITQEAFSQNRDDYTKLFSKGLNERFAHEIAHQYWGHQVKWAGDTDAWLSESFSEYCAALLIRRMRGDSTYKDMVARWRAEARDVGAYGTLATANRLLGERGQHEDRTHLLYSKGPYLLYALHRDLGDERFLTFLKTLQSNLRWKFASTSQVEDLLQFIARKPYGDFFTRYYWGTEVPAVKD